MKKAILGIVLLAFCPALWGQSTGTITGNVLDPSGAAIPAVEVTATNLATNVVARAQSSGAGTYTIPLLNPGDYRVEATLTGFKSFRQEPINVFTGSSTRLDINMEVGAVTETVEVLAQATTLQLEDSQMSAEIEQRTLFDLPLQLSGANSGGTTGRRTLDAFILLTPGVVGNQFSKSINGSQNLSTDTIIDGISWQINIVPGLIGTFGPPYESVEEFKIQTSNFPAEYSRGFGVTNFTMKSGTNEFHGNAFNFLRNDALEATPFFSNATGTEKAVVRQNEWGATLGGPIIKDKTFFFFAYTGFKLRGGAAQASTVTLPTPAMKRGDFSAWLNPAMTGAAIPIVIYDPMTRQPFPGNIIPADRISGIAAKVLPHIPDPDFAGRLDNNFLSRSSQPTDDWDYSIKIDHNISTRQKIAYSMWVQQNLRDNRGTIPGPLDDGFLNDEAGRGIRLNYDFFLTPTLVHHVGIGYGRRRSDFFPPEASEGFDNRAYYNIPNVTQGPGDGIPSFRFPNITSLGGRWDITIERGNTYNFVDTLTWIKGKHTIKTGFDARNYGYNVNYCIQCQGVFNFDNRATSLPGDANFGTLGHEFASFLIGHPASMRQERGVEPRGFRNGYWAGFVQDEIKLTPKLTMNIGIRIESPLPVAEQYDRLSALDQDKPNPGAGNLPGALAFAGTGPGRTGERRFAPIPIDWAPRLGFAYQLNEKTVIRTGFGTYFTQTNGNAADGNLVGAVGSGFNYVFYTETTDNGTTPPFILDEGPHAPFGNNLLPDLPLLDPSLQNGSQVDYINSNSHKTSHAHAWNFSVQRELPGRILLDVGYVGQRGINLSAGLEQNNQVPMGYLSLGPMLTKDINDPEVVAAGFSPPFAGFTGSLAQALRPFPHYLRIAQFQEPTGSSMYHSFQMKIQKRFSRGLSFLISYTASKTLTNAGGTPFSNGKGRPPFTEQRGLEWAIGPADRPQNLITSAVYELPFGPGKPFANTGGAAGKIVGGWQIAAITRYFSGTPIGVGGGDSLPLFGGSNRPNQVSGTPIRSGVSPGDFDPNRDKYLNINAFSQPAPFTRGQMGPRVPNVRSFTTLSEDVTLFKFIPFTETIRLEFRAEFYNLFNRVVFGGPSANINDPAAFGNVGGTALTPRQIQMALKIHF